MPSVKNEYHIDFINQVYVEIDEAYDHYEDLQAGLGIRLLNAVEQAKQDILSNPLGYQIKYDNYRTRIASPFPYVLVYEVTNKEIIVYQFFCSVDDPAKQFKK